MGHASRCIPIIRELIANNQHVILGGDGIVYDFLYKEYPQLEMVEFPSLNMRYSKGSSQVFKILVQIPKFNSFIRRDHNFLKTYLKSNKIDIIISDNRYGLWNRNVYTILITHQLMLKLPGIWKVFEKVVHRVIKKWVKRFNECWVPDYDGGINLTGELSHKYRLLPNTKFIGLLSRFSSNENEESKKNRNDLLIILSGPEPQRTILEEKIIKQIEHQSKQVTLVRGISGNVKELTNRSINIIPFLKGKEVLKEIIESKCIISRAGYTTIMDLLTLRKKAILIPTPGQTEQEYLSKYLKNKEYLYFVKQKDFDMEKDIKRLKELKEPGTEWDVNLYKKYIHYLLGLGYYA